MTLDDIRQTSNNRLAGTIRLCLPSCFPVTVDKGLHVSHFSLLRVLFATASIRYVFYIEAGFSGFVKGLSSRPKIMKCVTRSRGTNNVGIYQTAPKFGTTST